MKKDQLLQFIEKYHVGGDIETVLLKCDGNQLKTNAITQDKSMIAFVSLSDINFPEGEYGIYTTSVLKNMISILNDDIVVNVDETSIQISDDTTTSKYMLASNSVIVKTPEIKLLPDFEVTLKPSNDFITKFIKSKATLNTADKFTFESDGKISKITVGETLSSASKVILNVDADVNGPVSPLTFSATNFRSVLIANKNATDISMMVSSEGLFKATFTEDKFRSEYYLTKLQQ
jgi:hypothetical protein